MSSHSDTEKKPIYKKWWFWVIIIIIIIAIGASGTSDESTTTSSNTSQTESQTEATSISVGEEIITDSLKITFVSTSEYTDYSSYSTPSDGNKIIRAEFIFENISDSDVSLNSITCYADNTKCDSYYSASDYSSPALETISSGRNITAIVYYEVPSDAESIVLEYETNLWTDEKIEFIVQ